MVQPFIELGPFTFYYYGFFIALAIFAYFLSLRLLAQKSLYKALKIESAFLFCLIFALIGARFYHILSNLPYYLMHPLEAFFVWQGGLGIFGAILGGMAGLYIFSKVQEIQLISLLNVIAPPLLLAQAIGRIGNFINKEGFGPPTNLPWKFYVPISARPPMFIGSTYFHPTFFYEAILCLEAFVLYLIIRKRVKKFDFGFAYYLIAYGVIRLITEFFRIDTWLIGGLKVGFLAALAMILGGVGIIFIFWTSYRASSKA
jgi:phosphatidylglycerol:prolipoprotein diacylglycerol transferase